ncbi:hypothetical protein K474DRAFT_1704695 [Panus rudis PR-1116 ss-1]|nr:hypothetical protein K474DRAFT_1704695 [Panus rudis PR-1116 ss-1]
MTPSSSDHGLESTEYSDKEKASDLQVATLEETSPKPETAWEGRLRWVVDRLKGLGVEVHGIEPIPPEQRTDRRMYQMFFVWFSANINILTFSTGTVGPAFFSFGMRTTFILVTIVDAICCLFPAIFATFGPKLGARSMVQTRYSWGYYGAMIPSILNVISMQCYLIINTMIGGLTFSSVSDRLPPSAGIVIIAAISFVIAFSGYRVLHWYGQLAWIPNVIGFIIMLGLGGRKLIAAPLSDPVPVTAAAVISFAAAHSASLLGYSPMTPDYGIYHDAKVSSVRVFIYTYLGFLAGCYPAHLIGASFAAATVSVPAWREGLGNGNDVGGLIAAILSPTHGFGKFMVVLLALTTPSACAPTLYTACTSFMAITATFAKIPRFLLSIVSLAILIPVAIFGATHFYATFVEILNFIGYWLAPFLAIVLTEHVLFRRCRWSAYNIELAWNQPKLLPKGYAAVTTFILTLGVIAVSMSQTWYMSPIARAGAGNVGIMLGFGSAVLMYAILRSLEKRIWKNEV